MHVWLTPLAIALALLLFWVYIVWRSVTIISPAENPLGWRPRVTFAALLLVTISTGLAVFLLIHAGFTGGYPFYDPVEMSCIRAGFLCAFLAVLAAPVGMKKLRLSVSLLAVVTLVLWLWDGMAQ